MSQATYEAVTQRITEALAKGVVPWRKPWGESAALPCNAVSGRPYSGINLFLLSLVPFHDHRWVTFRQARELGGYVRPGETSSLAIFWKQWEPSNNDEDGANYPKKRFPVLKNYHVFNVSQCDDLLIEPLSVSEERSNQRIEKAEGIIASMADAPMIDANCKSAWYRPGDDQVGMPPLTAFRSADTYYSTLLHELIHSTGHEKRLCRKGIMEATQFGSSSYGHEELVAELGSAFLCAVAGLDNSLIGDSASYISHWLSVLKHDPKAMVVAAAQAKRAADYIQGVSP